MRLRIQNILLVVFIFSVNFEVWDPFNTGGFFSIAKFTGFLYAASLIPKLKYFLALPKAITTFLNPIILFYLLLVVLNIFNIGNNTTSFLETSMLQNIILFWFLLNHERLNPGIIEKGFMGFLFGSLALAILYKFGIGVNAEVGGRVSIFGDNQNNIGIRMAISSLFLTYLIFKQNKNRKKLVFLAMLLTYIPLIDLMINTGSRVSFISLSLGLMMFFLLYRTRAKILKPLILIVGVGLIYFIFQAALQTEVLGDRLAGAAEDGDLAGRDRIWSNIIPLIKDNFIYGVGRNGYIEYMTSNYGRVSSPHNVILEVLAYTGIIGLSIFLYFLFKAFNSSYVYYRKYKNLVPLIFILPLTGLLLSGQILYTKIAWLIFAYAASRKLYLK